MELETDQSIVILTSSDDVEFRIDKKVVFLLKVVDNFIKDTDSNKFFLPNVSSKILEKVIQYCEHHKEEQQQQQQESTDSSSSSSPLPFLPLEEKYDNNNSSRDNEIDPWDEKFCEIDQSTLFELIAVMIYIIF